MLIKVFEFVVLTHSIKSITQCTSNMNRKSRPGSQAKHFGKKPTGAMVKKG